MLALPLAAPLSPGRSLEVEPRVSDGPSVAVVPPVVVPAVVVPALAVAPSRFLEGPSRLYVGAGAAKENLGRWVVGVW